MCSYDNSYMEVINDPPNYISGYTCKKLVSHKRSKRKLYNWEKDSQSTDVYNMVIWCNALYDEFNSKKLKYVNNQLKNIEVIFWQKKMIILLL